MINKNTIKYLSCAEVDDSVSYCASRAGFCDYIIPFIHVYPSYRKKGLGSLLLAKALENIPDKGTIKLSFANNTGMGKSCLRNKGKRDKISQYELYLIK